MFTESLNSPVPDAHGLDIVLYAWHEPPEGDGCSTVSPLQAEICEVLKSPCICLEIQERLYEQATMSYR